MDSLHFAGVQIGKANCELQKREEMEMWMIQRIFNCIPQSKKEKRL